MDAGLAADAEEQRLAQEAQAKAMNDQQAEMEAKAKADQEAQAHLPPPPFRPLAEPKLYAVHARNAEQIYARAHGAGWSRKGSGSKRGKSF
jgi:membrane protein involved in colicin uptake